jgi:FSR family fosmidomycin resistance protein-like MFS transporter
MSLRTTDPSAVQPGDTLIRVLLALSVSHMLNDILQTVIPALYPLLKESFGLNFTQIGLITFVFQLTGSLLQPLVGTYTDRHPLPYSLPIGMAFTLVGIVLFSQATHFYNLILAAAFTGTGSAIFHPEASRLARLASGGRHGFAQSLFQVGGNFGSAFGPLLAAAIVGHRGQSSLLWFTVLAVAGLLLLGRLGRWYQTHLDIARSQPKTKSPAAHATLPRRRVMAALVVLAVLIFSKYFYLASITNYYTFYLIERFALSVGQAQICLFVFLFAVAAGTIIGGPVGDRIGRKYVIWVSILGVAPFTIALPYTGLAGTIVLSVLIGTVLASAFSAILVYATELVPGRVGAIAGLFFGFAFGMAGIGSALLGKLADHTSIVTVYHVCSFLPLLGIVTVFLPDLRATARR